MENVKVCLQKDCVNKYTEPQQPALTLQDTAMAMSITLT